MGFGFEKHLRKTDPFVIELSWKFLPGWGAGRVQWPLLVEGSAAVLLLFGTFWEGLCLGAVLQIFPVAPSSAEEVSALFPSWQCIPALQLDFPWVRQFFVWHLCALHCGKSWSWEHRVFLPFWREPPAGDFLLLGPRQEPGMKLEAEAAIKVGDEVNIKHWTSHSTPSNIMWKIYALKAPSSAFHSFTGCFLPSPAGSQLRRDNGHRQEQAVPWHPPDLWLQLTGWDSLSSPTPSTEREHSQKGCKQSGPVMSSQLIDYRKYNWILCLGEI